MNKDIKEIYDGMKEFEELFYIDNPNTNIYFEFGTNGYDVTFIKVYLEDVEITLYHSESNDRKYFDDLGDYEPIVGYLVRTLKKVINNLNKVKL